MMAGMSKTQRTTQVRALAPARTIVAAVLAAAATLGMASAQEVSVVHDEASLEAEIRAFLGSDLGYQAVDVAALEADIESGLPPSDSVFLSSGRVSPLAKAMLALESEDGALERTRHHVSVRVLEVTQPPASDPVAIAFVQVDRYNLGPAIRDELVLSFGESNVAPAATFGEGPHVSWRLVVRRLMGNEAAIIAAARAEVPDSQAALVSCLGVPCLQTSGGIEDMAAWHAMETADLAGESESLVSQATRDGLDWPAAMLDLAAAQAHFNAYESEVTGRDAVVAEFVIESNLAQEAYTDVALRRGHLLDDSVAAIWQRLLTFTTLDDAPEFYAAQAFECRRGEGGFAAPGKFCP